MSYTLEIILEEFSVCKLESTEDIDISVPFTFVSRTDKELSLVCPWYTVPDHVLQREDGWKAFRITGSLDFSLIGVLADIAGILAAERISIFAVSTFDTDYIFLKTEMFADGIEALRKKGYTIQG